MRRRKAMRPIRSWWSPDSKAPESMSRRLRRSRRTQGAGRQGCACGDVIREVNSLLTLAKPGAASMNLIQRAKNIIITPKTEWVVIAGETTSAQELIVSYVLPLAAVAAIASFIGTALFVGLLGSIVGARVGIGGAPLRARIHVGMAGVRGFVVGRFVQPRPPHVLRAKKHSPT